MNALALLPWIPLLPLAGFLVNGLFGTRYLSRRVVGLIACGAVLAAFGLSIAAVGGLNDEAGLAAAAAAGLEVDAQIPRVRVEVWDWIDAGALAAPTAAATTASLRVPWAYALDPLSAVMLLVVTGVGFLIHVYSIGYMAHDAGAARFFAYLNLFMAMMLVLVLADNFLVLFVGWEGVGLCSYLLIGFHTTEMFDAGRGMSCSDAGRKAFLVNRIGDFGFMLGMLLVLVTFGTLQFDAVLEGARGLAGQAAWSATLFAMPILLFVGATGKSAQIPLHVWLPDAMAGPTPVSALIHAATMVTAGVYMVCRTSGLFAASPWAMYIVALVGLATALLAGVIGMFQDDIKKVLAWSTVSQLGFMFLAAGVGAFSLALFHVVTHAFFKALLFLGAGSVIHALAGEQDTRRMGGLAPALPWTFATFLIGGLALSGIPPTAGFFSKDGILAAAFFHSGRLWAVAALTAGLTAYYTWRLIRLVFLGATRLPHDIHPHEAPWTMRGPLLVLAGLALAGGLFGLPAVIADRAPGLLPEPDRLAHWLGPVFERAGAGSGLGALGGHGPEAPSHAAELSLMVVSVLIALLGMIAAHLVFAHPRSADWRARLAHMSGGAWSFVRQSFRIDDLYEVALLRPFRFLCRAADAWDRFVVDLAVNVTGILVTITAHALKLAQSGSVRAYAFSLLGGVVLLVWLLAAA